MDFIDLVRCIIYIEIHSVMAGKQAKILPDQQTRSLLVFASSTRNPRRNHLILLLPSAVPHTHDPDSLIVQTSVRCRIAADETWHCHQCHTMVGLLWMTAIPTVEADGHDAPTMI